MWSGSDQLWTALSNTRAKNRVAKRASGYRFPELIHDLSFVIAAVGTRKAHAVLRDSLKIFPTARHTLGTRLAKVDMITAPGICMSRFSKARAFYDSIGYTSHFYWLSSDATALRPTLTIGKDGRLLGLCTLKAVIGGDTMKELLEAVQKYKIATRVDLLLLNPIDTRFPSYPIAVFPQVCTPPHEVLVERWNVIDSLFAEQGMCVLAHGSDGDAPQLKAMLVRGDATRALPADRVVFSFANVPCITGGMTTVAVPARRMANAVVHGKQLPVHITCPVLSFQDPCHEGLKLRSSILNRQGIGVRLGDGRASLAHLTELLRGTDNVYCETSLGIQSSDPDPYDRMNFPAFERLCGERLLTALDANRRRDPPLPPARPFTSAVPCQPCRPVSLLDSLRHRCTNRLPLHPSELSGLTRVELAYVLGIQLRQRDRRSDLQQLILNRCPAAAMPPPARPAAALHQTGSPLQPAPRDTRHLAAYIRFARAAVFAFVGDHEPEHRLFLAWYARYFADGWRAWLVARGAVLRDDFITTNQHSCVTINAESLLLYYHFLCSHDALRTSLSASPVGVGSQQNEDKFREVRAMGNDPNFTLGEFMRRLGVAHELEVIKRRRVGIIQFPAHHKHVYSDHIRRPPQYLPAQYNEQRALEILAAALKQARDDLARVGIVVPVVVVPPAPALPPPKIADLRDEIDESGQQASFVDDAEFDAIPRGFFDPSDSEDDLDEDDDDLGDSDDSSDDSSSSHDMPTGSVLGGFALTDEILDAHFADQYVGERPSKHVETDSGDLLLRTSAVAMVSGRAKVSRDRCVKYKKRKKDK